MEIQSQENIIKKPNLIKYLAFSLVTSIVIGFILWLYLFNYDVYWYYYLSGQRLVYLFELMVYFVAFIASVFAFLFTFVYIYYYARKLYSLGVQEKLYRKLILKSFWVTALFAVIIGTVMSMNCSGFGCMAIIYFPLYAIGYFFVLAIFSSLIVTYLFPLWNDPSKSDFLKKLKRSTGGLFLIIAFILGIFSVINFYSCDNGNSVCFAIKAYKKNDLSLCHKSSRVGECFSHVAPLMKDDAICGRIDGSNMHDHTNCFSYMAEATKNSEFCEKIRSYKEESDDVSGENEIRVARCLWRLVNLINDGSLCQKFIHKYDEDTCLERVNLRGKNVK